MSAVENPLQELMRLRAESLDRANRELTALTAQREDFALSSPLGCGEVPLARLVGMTSIGRPGARGELFGLGDWAVQLDGDEIGDLGLRVWSAILALANREGSFRVDVGARELAAASGETWGGSTGKRIEMALQSLRRVNLRVKRNGQMHFDGSLLAAVWRLEDGGWGIRLVPETADLLRGFGKVSASAWHRLGASGRKVAAYLLFQPRGVQRKLGRAKLFGLLGWEGRPVKAAQRDLRNVMAEIEGTGVVDLERWDLSRSGMLTFARTKK